MSRFDKWEAPEGVIKVLRLVERDVGEQMRMTRISIISILTLTILLIFLGYSYSGLQIHTKPKEM
jgi:hypothetical protein